MEAFGGMDAGEAYDPAAFERFKERMAAATAGLAAQQKDEKKRRKSEDELIKMLVAFLKSGQHPDILLLVARLLEKNVPASFIVSVLSIFSTEIQQKMGVQLLPTTSERPEGARMPLSKPSAPVLASTENTSATPNLPQLFGDDSTLPLKLRIAIVNWINLIQQKVDEQPHRMIETLLEPPAKTQLLNTAPQLAAFCLREFLDQHKAPYEFPQLKNFALFMLSDIIGKAKKELESRRELSEGDSKN